MSLSKRILESGKPFILFHASQASNDAIRESVAMQKSMDLDICVDKSGREYLGRAEEYYEKTGEPKPESVPVWDAAELVSKADIPVVIDCKHYDVWQNVEELVSKIGEERCLVYSLALELKFNYSRKEHEPDFPSEWSPLGKLRALKEKYPNVSTSAGCKWLPADFLISDKYDKLLDYILEILKNNRIDTISLNVPGGTFSDRMLRIFLRENIIPHIMIDGVDTSRLKEIYIGDTNEIALASKSLFA